MLAAVLQKLLSSTVSLRYTVDGWLYRQPEATRKAFAHWRNAAKSRPILVVGNGPSLNETPLEEFAHIPAIGMNKIDLLFPRTTWRPSLIVCVNNLVAQQNRAAFAATDIPVFLAWKCRWFMGRTTGDHLHYFKNRPTLEFSKDVTQGVACLGSTVTYSALQFAYYLGGNPVILFGVDHSFQVTTGRTGIARSVGADLNHFDPNYFSDGDYWGLPDLAGNEIAYARAKKAFADDGREILDATVGGQLQVFRKISLEDARRLVHAKSAQGAAS